MAERIGVLGSGQVAQALASGFKKHGYEVKMGTREPAKLADFAAKQRLSAGSLADAAAFGAVIVLAVHGTGAEEALKQAGAANLAGKVIIDVTNPIANEPPVHGVLRFFTGPNDSLMERLQKVFPAVRFVKAFNSVGNALMIDPKLHGGPPTMFICGNDAAAKTEVTGILEKFGWAVEDMGMVESARAIEPLCQLWCIPGLLQNRWNHAFRLLKA
jgi:hypothetical protein